MNATEQAAACGGTQENTPCTVGADPAILLAYRPAGNLDSESGAAMMTLLDHLHRKGATICMITHDPRERGTPTASVTCSTAASSNQEMAVV